MQQLRRPHVAGCGPAGEVERASGRHAYNDRSVATALILSAQRGTGEDNGYKVQHIDIRNM